MRIERLQCLSEQQVEEVLLLMRELSPDSHVTPAMVRRAVEGQGTTFFAVMDGERIVGCASLCVYDSPTGRKASIEDVVVLSSYRGQHLGKRLMEHVITYARQELKTVSLYLTSRPHRIAANELYRSLGFRQKETNVYVLKFKVDS